MRNKEIPLSEFSQRHADGIARSLSYMLSKQYDCEVTVTAKKKTLQPSKVKVSNVKPLYKDLLKV